jgi:hypothetical protein
MLRTTRNGVKNGYTVNFPIGNGKTTHISFTNQLQPLEEKFNQAVSCLKQLYKTKYNEL